MALVRRHHGCVRRYVSGVMGSGDVDDVVQETFLAVLSGAGGYSGEGAVRAWVLSIARRKIARHFRRKVGEPARYDALEDLGLRAGWGDPELSACVRQRVEHLRQALARLPEASREIITLRDVEGLTGPEAAEVLGISLAATKSRLHRARLELMAQLREVDHG